MALGVSKSGKVFDNSANLWSQLNPQNVNSPDFKKKFDQEVKRVNQVINTAQVPMTPEAVAGYAQTMRDLPEYQDMIEEDATVKRMRDAVANLPIQERHGWVAPLAALTDTWTGSKMAGSVPKIEGNAELLLGLQDKVEKNKKNQLEQILSATDKFKAGTVGTTQGTTESIGAAAGQGGGGKAKDNPYVKKYLESAGTASGKGDTETDSLIESLEKNSKALYGMKDEKLSPFGFGGGVANWINKAGFDPKIKSTMDKLNSIAVRAESQYQKGAMSEKDRDLIVSSLTSVGGDAETFKENVEIALNALKASAKKEKAKRMILSKGGMPEDVEKSNLAIDEEFGAGKISQPTKKAPMSFEEWKAAKAKGKK